MWEKPPLAVRSLSALHGKAKLNLCALHRSPPGVTTVRRLPYLYTLCAGYAESFLELLLKQVSEVSFHLTKIQVSGIPSSISSSERCLI